MNEHVYVRTYSFHDFSYSPWTSGQTLKILSLSLSLSLSLCVCVCVSQIESLARCEISSLGNNSGVSPDLEICLSLGTNLTTNLGNKPRQ